MCYNIGMSDRKLTIGLLIDLLSSEYIIEIYEGVRKYCNEHDISLLVFQMGHLEERIFEYNYQYVAITAFANKNNVDAIIFLSGNQLHFVNSDFIRNYLNRFNSLNVVNISGTIPGIPSINVKSRAAYKALVNFTLNQKKSGNILFLGVEGNSPEVRERTEVFYECLKENKISEKNVTVLYGAFDYALTTKVLNNYLEINKNFDFNIAIALNDDMAISCIDFCKKLGKNIPEDIIITGFDDTQHSFLCNPPLSTINQQIFEQGYMAAKILDDLHHGKTIQEEYFVDAKALLRKSTGEIKSDIQIDKNLIDIDRKDNKELIRRDAAEWYSKCNQLFQVTKFYTDMQYDMSLRELKGKLLNNFKNFDISGVAIVLYEQPVFKKESFVDFAIPDTAYILTGYDNFTDFNMTPKDSEIYFNPQESLLPEGSFEYTSDGVFVISLFHGYMQYGYIVFRKNEYTLSVYDILVKTVSSVVETAYSYTKAHKIQNDYIHKYQEIDIIANTDELTGITNRRGFLTLGNNIMENAKIQKTSGLVVFCDMDGLKSINDTYGHEAGDLAIKAEAEILKKNFRSNDIVARMGGDEFCIIALNMPKRVFNRIKQNVDNSCKDWVEKNNAKFNLSLSMGYIEFTPELNNYKLSNLLSLSDAHLYEVKRKKKKAAAKANEIASTATNKSPKK